MASSLNQTECPECGQVVHYQPQRWKAQVVCSNCQETFAVEASANSTAAVSGKTPLPSHLQSPSPDVGMPQELADEESATALNYKRSKAGGPLIVVLVILVFVAAIGAGVIYLVQLDRVAKSNGNDNTSDRDKGVPEKIKYLLAGKKKGRIGGVEVAIRKVEYAPLRVKDQNFKVHDSSEMVLQVYLEVRTKRMEETVYTSWYGNLFKRGDVDVEATLQDETGRLCLMPVYEGVSTVQGNTPFAKLEKNQRVNDCIIFSLPEGVGITDIKELRLKLPMETVSSVGDIYFKIPRDDVKLYN